MEFKSRILIINDNRVQFYRDKFYKELFDEIEFYSKQYKIPYPFEIWQDIVYQNGKIEQIRLCTILKNQKK